MPFLSRISRFYERCFSNNPKLTVAVTNALLKCLGDFMAQIVPYLRSSGGLASFEYDAERSLRFFIFGFLYGPVMGAWHMMIEHYLPLARTTTRSALYPLSPHPAEKGPMPAGSPNAKHVKSLSQGHARAPSSAANGHVLPPPPMTAQDSAPKAFVMMQLMKRVIADQVFYAPLFIATFLTIMPLLEHKGWAGVQDRFSTHYWHIVTTNWKVWPWIQLVNYGVLPLQYRVPWQGACGVCWTIWLSVSTHPTTPSPAGAASSLGAEHPVAAAAAVAKAVLEEGVNPTGGVTGFKRRVKAHLGAEAAATAIDAAMEGT